MMSHILASDVSGKYDYRLIRTSELNPVVRAPKELTAEIIRDEISEWFYAELQQILEYFILVA